MLPDALAASIRESCGDELLLDARRGRALISAATRVPADCARLKRLGFTRLIDFSGAHTAIREDGRDEFALWALLRNPAHAHCALLLKWRFLLDPKDPVAHPSLALIWPNAGLYERELLEMLGLPFSGNENLAPLLLDEQLAGHPLRRDFAPPRWPNYAGELLRARHEAALIDGLGLKTEGQGSRVMGQGEEEQGQGPRAKGPGISSVGTPFMASGDSAGEGLVPPSRWNTQSVSEGESSLAPTADSASAVPTVDSMNAVPTEDGGPEPAATGGAL